MKINANLLRNGNIIRYQNKILQILNTHTIKQGKGGAYVQLEMRDLENGSKLNERLRTSENVEKLVTEEINSTFLYSKDNSITLMNNETYEQFEVPLSLVSDKKKLLEDGIQLVSETVDGEIINIRFPKIPKQGIFFLLHSFDKCLANLLSTIVYKTIALLFFSETSRILEI